MPPPYRLTQTLSPQPPVAYALRAMPDVCSPTLEQPDAPAPQELEHAVEMPLPGNEVHHHSTQAPLPPMLLIEARWPGPNPFASATPRPPLFMRRPAALLVILLMLLGARCALRPVAVILSVASPPESPFMPKDGGMGVDPARERAKALESAVLECAASMSKEQDAFFHALQVERAAEGEGGVSQTPGPAQSGAKSEAPGAPGRSARHAATAPAPNERCRKGAQGSTLARCSPRQDESQLKAQGGGTLGAGANASVDIRGSGLEFRGKSLMREVCPSCKLRGEREGREVATSSEGGSDPCASWAVTVGAWNSGELREE